MNSKLSAFRSSNQNDPILFIGTYTEPMGSNSEGIYVYRMDANTGQLNHEGVVPGVTNPSFLGIHPSQNVLYAVNEVETHNGQGGGEVSAFSVDTASGELRLLNKQLSHGAHPCYVSVEQTGQFVLVANYTTGSIAMFPIRKDGSLDEACDVIQHSGSSIHPTRQTGPHAHCILTDPSNQFAITVDLGLDKLLVYRLDLERGKLHLHGETIVHAGAGPRHVTFHPNGQFAYLINELDTTVIAYGYDGEAGRFEQLQSLPALPKEFKGENLSADIHVTPDGNYLYASNRGHDSFVCFRIQETGTLLYEHHTLTGGREPRNFAIDPSGNFLLAANQKSNNIITFRIDPINGQLIDTGYRVNVPMPVCVKFVS